MLLAPRHIFFRRHHYRRGEPGAANARANDVAVDGVVVHHVVFYAVWPLQVHGVLVEVVIGYGRGALYLPPRLEAVGRHGSPARHCDGEKKEQEYVCLPE